MKRITPVWIGDSVYIGADFGDLYDWEPRTDRIFKAGFGFDGNEYRQQVFESELPRPLRETLASARELHTTNSIPVHT